MNAPTTQLVTSVVSPTTFLTGGASHRVLSELLALGPETFVACAKQSQPQQSQTLHRAADWKITATSVPIAVRVTSAATRTTCSTVNVLRRARLGTWLLGRATFVGYASRASMHPEIRAVRWPTTAKRVKMQRHAVSAEMRTICTTVAVSRRVLRDLSGLALATSVAHASVSTYLVQHALLL
jgi:hypothetical protein